MMDMYMWEDLPKDQELFLSALVPGEFLSLRYDVVRMFKGDCTLAVLFTDLLYWSRTNKAKDADGWFYRTASNVTNRLGISRSVQERARKTLLDMRIIEKTRKGLPAKNYYRINLSRLYLLLSGVETISHNKMPGMETAACSDPPQPDVANRYNIVNESVDQGVEVTPPYPSDTTVGVTAPQSDAKKKVSRHHVLGDRADEFIAWVQRQYPLKPNGLGATEEQARTIAWKLGGVPPTASPEARAEAKAKLDEFILGLKNFRDSVKDGTTPAEYVPVFHRFAGIGNTFGVPPGYKDWAHRKIVQKKRRLVV